MKKTLTIIFYTSNINENSNMDKDIVNMNNYLEKENLA